MTKPKKNNLKKCVLNCQDDNKLFSFPEQTDAYKLWLKTLGLSGTPLCRSEMYVCLNHFSSRQLTHNGRTITPISIPDKNIPGKEDPPESEVEAVQPPAKNHSSSLTDTPLDFNKEYVMITSDSSKCYLKCKTYRSVHRFPTDLTSFNIWLGKLGIPETIKLKRTASLCDNHFSPAMRTPKSITKCAVPDIYLPSQCTFIDESDAPSIDSILETMRKEKTTSIAHSQPIIIDEPKTAEILTNPDTNIKSAVDFTATNDVGTALTFESSLKPTSDVICPENYKNSAFECVLKCPDSKTLYRFPNVESRRQLWLSQIGLTHCFCNTRICNRHFSEKMLSNKRLTNSSFPDINLPEPLQPRIRVASLPLQNEARYVVQELPQYICALTVLTNNNKINTVINNNNYVKYTVNKKVPKRERSVQVELDDLFGKKVNVAILADEDFDDDELDIVENINFEQQPDLTSNMAKAEVFPSKSKDMFECLKCGEISLDDESNQRHLNLHNELSRLCFHCGRMFTSDIRLNMHEMEAHSLQMKKLIKRCPKEHCKKAFHSRKNLHQHLNEHVKPTRHFCDNCGRLFFSFLKLNCHLLVCKPKNVRSRIKR